MAELLASFGARLVRSSQATGLVTKAAFASINNRGLHGSASLRSYFNVQDETDFQERVVKSKQPIIVDFFATWCGPCKLLDPRLKTAISEFEGKTALAKVDIDELQELAIKFNVTSVPTVVAIKDGAVTDKFVGLADEDKIKAFIKKAISA